MQTSHFTLFVSSWSSCVSVRMGNHEHTLAYFHAKLSILCLSDPP